MVNVHTVASAFDSNDSATSPLTSGLSGSLKSNSVSPS